MHALPDLYGVVAAARVTCARTDDKSSTPTIHRTNKNKINWKISL